MNGIWKLNGMFFGWVTNNGSLYSQNGNRIGTLIDNVFYNHNGAYIGELLNNNRIGYNSDHNDWVGPVCYVDGQILAEPLENLLANEVIGYNSPE
ncbi:hypothetical protein [Winogradskyella poriferorum]|uniref:WG repeat-containing protein n=1 Tax=Winogradskyella poriferorum TaxID=307627 RepID=A0ABU7W3G9_9FLAO